MKLGQIFLKSSLLRPLIGAEHWNIYRIAFRSSLKVQRTAILNQKILRITLESSKYIWLSTTVQTKSPLNLSLQINLAHKIKPYHKTQTQHQNRIPHIFCNIVHQTKKKGSAYNRCFIQNIIKTKIRSGVMVSFR